MVGRGILLHKSSKRIDFSFALAYTETHVPERSSQLTCLRHGTRDTGGHVLAMSLGPVTGSDELILDLPVIPSEGGALWDLLPRYFPSPLVSGKIPEFHRSPVLLWVFSGSSPVLHLPDTLSLGQLAPSLHLAEAISGAL